MTLQEALTEAARVAVVERGRWIIVDGTVWSKTTLQYIHDVDNPEQFIASRVNAAVFAWWAQNIQHVPELCAAMRNADDLGVSGFHAVSHILASGEAS